MRNLSNVSKGTEISKENAELTVTDGSKKNISKICDL